MLTTLNNKHPKSSFIPFIAMSKIFSQIALLVIVIANINPVLAASKHQNTELSKQKLDYQENTQEMIVAGWLDNVMDTVRDVNKTRDAINRSRIQQQEREQRLEERRIRMEMQQREREQRLQQRQAREEERKRRQQELIAARKAATQRQIQEAEKRRQYFDSLSPEQKQAYIKQQQELRQKQTAAKLFMLGLFAEFLAGSGGSSSGQQTPEYNYRIENNTSAPTNNYTPAPAPTIHPNYGSCHHYDC